MYDPKKKDTAYGVKMEHESVGVGHSGSDTTEHLKGRKQLQRARDLYDASINDPQKAEDKKARSKSGKKFLRDIK
jgi:hypothetical protein